MPHPPTRTHRVQFFEDEITDDELRVINARATKTGGIVKRGPISTIASQSWTGGIFFTALLEEMKDLLPADAIKEGTFKATDRYCRVSDLEPAKRYKFRLRAKNNKGWSPFGPSCEARETFDAPFIVSRTMRSLTVGWRKMQAIGNKLGEPEKYELQIQEASDAMPWATISNTLTILEQTIEQLLPATEYRFRVRPYFGKAGSWAAWSGSACSYFMRTEDEWPEPIEECKVNEETGREYPVSCHEVDLCWKRKFHLHGRKGEILESI